MTSNINNASLFLVNTLFSLYAYVLLLRVLLQWTRADFYNPLAQFIWKATNPPTQVLRKVIPRYRQWDIPALIIFSIVVLLNMLIDLMILNVSAGLLGLLAITLMKMLVLIINLLTFCILVQAVMSWFGTNMHSPASSLLFNINEPLLRPARRIIPNLGGLDLSPLVVILILQVFNRLIPLSYALR
ncbi:MAG: YggT family protein [Oceanococcus sp.]